MNKLFFILLMVTGACFFLYFGYTALLILTSDSLLTTVYRGHPLLAVLLLSLTGVILFIAGFLFLKKSLKIRNTHLSDTNSVS